MLGLQPQFTVGRGGGAGACKQQGYKLRAFTYRAEEVNRSKLVLVISVGIFQNVFFKYSFTFYANQQLLSLF
jgi:hypothetical protein